MWGGADVDMFVMPAEQAEDLDGMVACASEPVRKAGVELGDIARPMGHDGLGTNTTVNLEKPWKQGFSRMVVTL